MRIFKKIINRETKIAVLGLGYVGLPLAVSFAEKAEVVGFDIDEEKINQLQLGVDPNGEIGNNKLKGAEILFTNNIDQLKDVGFYIVTVPTPIDSQNNPDLTILKSASKTIGGNLSIGDYVVFESTVYPGVTEEICIPILEKISGLKCGKEFKVGYSPERINPGDKVHTLENTIKVVSGCDLDSLDEITKVYKLVVKAGIHQAASIKIAEAAKIIENTQRDVNIALMNELSILFGRMGINTYDVLEAAGTKWNFLKFYPGLVGGHCIGVDPYYLAHKARELKYHPQIINSGRFVNDSMGRYTGKQIVKRLLKNGIKIPGAKALILGVTFKENVSDIRNSKVFDIVAELEEFGIDVTLTDPFANHNLVKEEYGYKLSENPLKLNNSEKFDTLVIAVSHTDFLEYTEKDFASHLNANGIIADVKGIFKEKIRKLSYWSL